MRGAWRSFVYGLVALACGARTGLYDLSRSNNDAAGSASGGGGSPTAAGTGLGAFSGASGGAGSGSSAIGGASGNLGVGGMLAGSAGVLGVGGASLAGSSALGGAGASAGEGVEKAARRAARRADACARLCGTIKRCAATPSGTCAANSCEYPSTDKQVSGRVQKTARVCCLQSASAEAAEHACATVNHGPVKCWGAPYAGVVGDANALQIDPTVVPGLESGVSKLSVGTNSACALMDNGDVKCWGYLFGGGLDTVAGFPSDVTDVTCAAPYFDHTCVLSPSQGVLCLGANNFGQLGNGFTLPSFTEPNHNHQCDRFADGATSISAGQQRHVRDRQRRGPLVLGHEPLRAARHRHLRQQRHTDASSRVLDRHARGCSR